MKQSKLEKISEVAGAIGNNLYLRSLRDAFILVIPFLVLGGIAIIFNYVIFSPDGFMLNFMDADTIVKVQALGTRILNGSMNIMSLLVAVLFAYNIANNKGNNEPFMVGIVALAAVFIMQPLSLTVTDAAGSEVVVSGLTTFANFSATGLFVAMITAALSSTLFIKLENKGYFKINLEGNIPPAVKRSFNIMSSIIITLFIVGLGTYIITEVSNLEIYELINKVLQAPLVGVTTSLPGFMLLTFLTNLLFSLGIHPGGIINPILEPPLLVAMQQNVDAYAAGIDIPNIIVLPFRDLYGHIGGTGSTIALIIAIFVASSRKEHKSFAKVALPTSVFNINEPIIFGFPVVFNPLIMIPFIFAPLLNYIVAYLVTSVGLVSKIVVYVPWSMPPFINAFIASGGDIRNTILQIALVAMDVLIWIVFLKLYEKSLDISEEK